MPFNFASRLNVGKKFFFPTLAALSICVSASMFSPCLAASLSQEDAGTEAARLLSGYLKVDTTNPPGNEKLGAEYLAGVLRKEGMTAEVFSTGTDSRACVYARLKGNGKKKGIVLLNHIDVVPAQAKDWKHAPFAGETHDGEIWGRGALDMKGDGIAQLEAMLQLKRRGVVLDRDIVFLATPDEEVGGQHGAGWVKKNRPDVVEGCEFLLNEGAEIDTDDSGKVLNWNVDIAEKSVLWLKVTAKGNASHGSVPIINSAPNRLVRALNRLINAPVELSILPVVQRYFTEIAPVASPELKKAYLDLTAASKEPAQVDLLMKDGNKAAMLRNTVSLTVLKGGYKTNVIPAEASAELDCRLLPGVKSEDFIAHLKQILKDDRLEIEVLDHVTAMPSNDKSLLFDAIKQVAADEAKASHQQIPPVVPVVVGWFTDSHWFRELGLTAYGFSPFDLDKAHKQSIHGKDERIPLKALSDGVHRFEQILLKLGQ